MRSVSASRGRWTPGRSVSTSCHSSGPRSPRRGSRGAWSAACRRRSPPSGPTIALTSVDLPTFGRPASATKPERVTRTHATISACSASISPCVGLVVHPHEVQHAVDDGLREVRRCARGRSRRRRARAGRRPRPSSSTGNESTSVGPSLAAVLGVERGDPLGVDELDRDVARPRRPPTRARSRTRRRSDSSGSAERADDLDLEHYSCVRRLRLLRRPQLGRRRAGSARRRRRRSAARACGARRPRRRSG